MSEALAAILVLVSVVNTVPVSGVVIDLETAKLTLDDHGAAALAFADGASWPAADQPAHRRAPEQRRS